MTEFEKWESDGVCNIRVECRDLDCGQCKEIKRSGFRAALKEVLKQLDIIYDGDWENSEIVRWINKELGDT